MGWRGCALIGALATAITPAGAQSVGRMLESDVRNGVLDVWGVWVSPIHARGRDWLLAGGVVAGSAVISPFDDNVDRWIVANENSSTWSAFKEFREGGVLFAGKTITPAAAGLYVVGLATKSTQIREGVWGCVSAYVATSLARNYVLYELIGRVRPDNLRNPPPGFVPVGASQGDQYKFSFPGDGWGKHSLPAGHVANVASCASFLGNRFDMGYFEPVPYALALAVGFGRMLDRRHWTSDTVLGFMMGYAAGKEVAKRSLQRLEKSKRAGGHDDDDDSDDTSGPFAAPMNGGIGVGWQWRF